MSVHPHTTLTPAGQIEKGVSRFRQAENSPMKRRDSRNIFPSKVESRWIVHGQREYGPITKLRFVEEDSLSDTFSVVEYLAAKVDPAAVLNEDIESCRSCCYPDCEFLLLVPSVKGSDFLAIQKDNSIVTQLFEQKFSFP